MRLFTILLLPLLLQVFAYALVFLAAQGGGSFMGLLAIPVAAGSLIALLTYGLLAARGTGHVVKAAAVSLAIVLVPPLLLMVVRALES
jgi:hypothetical protein